MDVRDGSSGSASRPPRDGWAGDELDGGSLAAFASTIWFVDAPLDAVAEAGIEWLGALGGRRFVPLDGARLPDMLAALEPWAMPSWKQIWVQTDSRWTAIFSQGSDIPTQPVLGRRLGCRSLRTHHAPRVIRHGRTVSHGDCAFWFDDGRGSSRTIQASFQSRWVWHLSGEPLPFESIEAYSARRIPDRFTLERLNTYCAALGIRRADPDFYLPRALLVEQDISSWPRPPRQLSSLDWRAQYR